MVCTVTGSEIAHWLFWQKNTTGAWKLAAKPSASERGLFSLSARFSFVAHAGMPYGSGAGEPEQLATWLATSEGAVQVTPGVATLANRLAAGAQGPFAEVMAFYDYMIDKMACGRLHLDALAGEPPTDWVIASGWFDCRLGAALLVALCRARGIPARLVGGYPLWQATSEHFWMEAWIPDRGWTPFDLLAWDLSAGGRDRAWRDVYAGAVDYRMTTQVFPEIFTGAPGVPMGAAWQRLARATPEGVETRLVSIRDGHLIYADTVRVVRL